ncbi:MAG: BON domain-containing protein [Acidobacteriaceae bacterium]
MKPKSSLNQALPVAIAALALAFSGCSSKPSDSQLTANVQHKIAADTALQGQPISASAKDGTVTLSGAVGSEGFRELAAKDAATVGGVRTVVNNLSIGNDGAPAPAANGNAAPVPGNEQTENIAPPPPPPPTAGAAPAAPPAPESIVIPAGTRIRVRLGRTLSSKHSQTGEPFPGTLASPVRVNGQTIIRAGAQARGVVTEAKSMGRFKGQAVLALRLESVSADGRRYPVRTSHIERVEQGKGKRSAVMTGGGAGFGAILGGIAGGGKGAAIGLLAGGGAGAAGSAFTGNKDIVLPAETVLTFDLQRSVTIRR